MEQPRVNRVLLPSILLFPAYNIFFSIFCALNAYVTFFSLLMYHDVN